MHPSFLSSADKRITAELLAYSVCQLFPDVIFVGGGVNQLGFYYDFIFSQSLPTDVLSLIEVELRKTLKEDHSIRFANMMRENAQNYFQHYKQPFLADKAAAEANNVLELLQIGTYSGLCPAYKILSTVELTPYIKLLELQRKEVEIEGHDYIVSRIIGNCFTNPQELKVFVKNFERHRKKANHIELGKQLNLFVSNEKVNEVETLWLPKGEILRQTLQDWIKPYLLSQSMQFVTTPTIIRKLKKKYSKDSLSLDFQGHPYQLASSRLAAHCQILCAQLEVKKTLPLKVMEYGLSYRLQGMGEIEGLLCSHSSYGDEATICCKKGEELKEIISFLLFIEQIIKIFSFEAYWCLVTSVKKGAKAKAEKDAIELLLKAVQSCQLSFSEEEIEEEEISGPRLELRIVDKLKRAWPCSTLTIVVHELKFLDFFGNQVKNNDKVTEVLSLLKQSIWGSLDRFIALLLERYEGNLPIWLAPEQARLLVINKNAQEYVDHIVNVCQEKGLKITTDVRDVKLSEKVHDAGKEKIPVSIVIGENEVNKKCLTVQNVQSSGKSQILTLDQFLDKELLEIKCPILKEEQLIIGRK